MNYDKQRQRAFQKEKKINCKCNSFKQTSKCTRNNKNKYFHQQSCPNNENQPLYGFQKTEKAWIDNLCSLESE